MNKIKGSMTITLTAEEVVKKEAIALAKLREMK